MPKVKQSMSEKQPTQHLRELKRKAKYIRRLVRLGKLGKSNLCKETKEELLKTYINLKQIEE